MPVGKNNSKIAFLDIGTADGQFLSCLKSRCGGDFELFGIDKFADSNLQEQNIRMIKADFLEFDFKDKTFDLITLFDVIEHIEDLHSVIQKIAKLLKPGGKLVIVTPNFESISRKKQGDNWGMLIAEHLNYFSINSLKRLIEMHGLSFFLVKNANNYFFSKVFWDKVCNFFFSKFFRKVNLGNVPHGITTKQSKVNLIFTYFQNDIWGIFKREGDFFMLIAKK